MSPVAYSTPLTDYLGQDLTANRRTTPPIAPTTAGHFGLVPYPSALLPPELPLSALPMRDRETTQTLRANER
jgi:hypothetical protein